MKRERVLALAFAAAGQFALIVIGVYLGLRAEQWRERRKDADATRAVLRAFRDEITANRAAVARVLPYHLLAGDSLAHAWKRHVTGGTPITYDALQNDMGYGGTRFVDLSATAYDLAVVTQAFANVEPTLALRLSRVYDRQRTLQRHQDQVAAALLTTPPDARGDWMRTTFVLAEGISEARALEVDLVAQYDSLLPRLATALGRR